VGLGIHNKKPAIAVIRTRDRNLKFIDKPP
jgi:hypothetical protein